MGKKERHSIFWALILIAIGAVLLLNTLGVLPGNAVELLLKLWPLLFIFGGIDNIIRGRGWIWAVISLGLGTVFLLANFNYLPWDSWNLLLRLWPLILVAIGLDLIFEGRKPIATLLGVLIALVIMVGVAWFAILNSPTAQLASTDVSQPIGDATSAYVRVSNPVGRLEMDGGASGRMLLEGTVQLPGKGSVDQKYTVQSSQGSLNLSASEVTYSLWSSGFNEPLWKFRLAKQFPITLNAETAVGSMALDLTGLDIDRLNASVAVGSLDITLDSQDALDGRVATPVGRIIFHIPQDARVMLQLDTAISTSNLPPGFTRDGKTIYSPNTNAATARVKLNVEQPIGLVSLEPIP